MPQDLIGCLNLIAAEFHFVHPVEKDSLKHHKLTQNSVSFSCQSKEVSRRCINFPHELTCQILTNKSIKTGRRAWQTRDHGEKSQKQLSSLPVIPSQFQALRQWGRRESKSTRKVGGAKKGKRKGERACNHFFYNPLPLTFGMFEIIRFRLSNFWNVNELESFWNFSRDYFARR